MELPQSRLFPELASIEINSSNSSTPAKVVKNNKVASNNNVLRPVDMGANSAPTPRPTDIATRSPQGAEKSLQAVAIEVSGVIEVEGKTQVIVKLPNESSSRYVSVGDRIANSKIVVKRVEDQKGLSPVVILEEAGVEVSRKVGDKPVISNPDSK
jgi:hypothetical protein